MPPPPQPPSRSSRRLTRSRDTRYVELGCRPVCWSDSVAGLHDHWYAPTSSPGLPLIGMTVDWVQDAARTQLRRKARRQEKAGISERSGRYTWKQKLYDAYDAGQAWIVVTLVGMRIRVWYGPR
jgi:hypothetical protein